MQKKILSERRISKAKICESLFQEAKIRRESFLPLRLETSRSPWPTCHLQCIFGTSIRNRRLLRHRAFPYDPNDPHATRKLDAKIKHDEFGKAAWPRDDYLNLWDTREEMVQRGLLEPR